MPDHHPIRTVLLGTLLALAAAVVPASVLAQTPTPAPTATATATPTPVVTPTPPLAPTTGPTRAQLESATYPAEVVPGGGIVTLVNGRFEAPIPGLPVESALRNRVTLTQSVSGIIAGRAAAAAITAENGGGTGTFHYLHVVDSAMKVIAVTALGDRIRVDSLTLNDQGRIVISGAFRRDSDAGCCPTLIQRRVYMFNGTELVLVQADTAAVDPVPTPVPPRPAATGTGGLEEARTLEASVAAVILGAVLVSCVAIRGSSKRAS